MNSVFAHRLGLIPHRSLLLRRAASLGLTSPEAFEMLAWQRGCRYYPPRQIVDLPQELDRFSQEELAIALVHPSLPWDPQRQRIAAAVMGAEGVSAKKLLHLLGRSKGCSHWAT